MKPSKRQEREAKRKNSFEKLFEKRKRAVLGVPASPLLPLDEMLEELRAIPDRDWGLYAFARENLRDRFTAAEKLALIDGALDCGRDYAREYLGRFPGQDPLELAKSLGLHPLFPDLPQQGGGQVLFARFTAPGTIEVFGDALGRARQALEGDQALRNILGDVEVRQVLLAHELFHFVEEQHRDTIFTEVTRIDVRPLGVLHNRSRILCLGEIAAMAFAKELLGLPYSPYLYDVFLLYLYSKQTACNLYGQIKAVLALAQQSA